MCVYVQNNNIKVHRLCCTSEVTESMRFLILHKVEIMYERRRSAGFVCAIVDDSLMTQCVACLVAKPLILIYSQCGASELCFNPFIITAGVWLIAISGFAELFTRRSEAHRLRQLLIDSLNAVCFKLLIRDFFFYSFKYDCAQLISSEHFETIAYSVCGSCLMHKGKFSSGFVQW